YLTIAARSMVKDGTLTVLVDGRQVYSRRLSLDEGASEVKKRLFRRRQEVFSVRIDVPPGRHRVVAQVFAEGKDAGHEDSAEVAPQGRTRLALVAGRIIGPAVSLKAE